MFRDSYGQTAEYAKAPIAVVMEYIENTRNVKSFSSGTALENIASLRLLEKLGLVLRETEKRSFHKDEKGNDIVFEGGVLKNTGAKEELW